MGHRGDSVTVLAGALGISHFLTCVEPHVHPHCVIQLCTGNLCAKFIKRKMETVYSRLHLKEKEIQTIRFLKTKSLRKHSSLVTMDAPGRIRCRELWKKWDCLPPFSLLYFASVPFVSSGNVKWNHTKATNFKLPSKVKTQIEVGMKEKQ